MRFFDDPPDDYWRDDTDLPMPLHERVTHLVFVDGRPVDQWSQPAQGTRWQPYADRFDRDRRPPQSPPVPPYERVLRWLDAVGGGRAAVLALGDEPLQDDGRDLPEAATRPEQHRLGEVAELLDGVDSVRLDAETGHALRAALHPHGTLRVRDLQDGLGLRSSPSAYGRVVERALVGFRDLDVPFAWRMTGLPELLPLGHPELLLARVRERLVRVRDQSLEAERSSAA